MNQMTLSDLTNEAQALAIFTFASSTPNPVTWLDFKRYVSDSSEAVVGYIETIMPRITQKEILGVIRIIPVANPNEVYLSLAAPKPMIEAFVKLGTFLAAAEDGTTLTFTITEADEAANRGKTDKSKGIYEGRISIPAMDLTPRSEIDRLFKEAANQCGMKSVAIHELTQKFSKVNTGSLKFTFEPAHDGWDIHNCERILHIVLPSTNVLKCWFTPDLARMFHVCGKCLRNTCTCESLHGKRPAASSHAAREAYKKRAKARNAGLNATGAGSSEA